MMKFIFLLFIVFITITQQTIYNNAKCQLKNFYVYDNTCSDNNNNVRSCYEPYFAGDLLNMDNEVLQYNVYIYRFNTKMDNYYFSEEDAKKWGNQYTLNQIYDCWYDSDIIYLENRDNPLDNYGFWFILFLGFIGLSLILCPIVFCIIIILICLTIFKKSNKKIKTYDIDGSFTYDDDNIILENNKY